jgi:hypothetical protein
MRPAICAKFCVLEHGDFADEKSHGPRVIFSTGFTRPIKFRLLLSLAWTRPHGRTVPVLVSQIPDEGVTRPCVSPQQRLARATRVPLSRSDLPVHGNVVAHARTHMRSKAVENGGRETDRNLLPAFIAPRPATRDTPCGPVRFSVLRMSPPYGMGLDLMNSSGFGGVFGLALFYRRYGPV